MKKTKNFLTVFTIILFTGIVFYGCQQTVDVTDQIKDANKAFMESFNSGNAHGVAMNYTEDAKLFPTNSDVIEGQEAIEAFWNGAVGMGVAKAELETVSAEATGNMAVEEGRYKLFSKDGQVIDQGKYIVNWKKVNGVWKLDKDIWNTSNPQPFSTSPEGFPVISEADRYSNAVAQFKYMILNSINFAKSKGVSVENIARFTGDQFKTSWNKEMGYDGFVKGTLRNWLTFVPNGEFKMLESDDNHIKLSVDNIYPWLKNDGPQMNVSYDDYLKFFRIVHEQIADYLGAVYSQEITPDGLVITITKK